MQGGIGFIILGGLFVVSLLKSLWNVINKDWDKEKFTVKSILSIFAVPLLSLLGLILFIAYVLPYLDK